MKIQILLFFLFAQIVLAHPTPEMKPARYMPNTIHVRMKAFSTTEEVRAALAPYGAHPLRQMLQPMQSLTFNSRANMRLSDNSSYSRILQDESPVLRTFVVQFTALQSSQKYCTYLMNSCAAVELAEPIFIERTAASKPNDAFVSQQDLLSVIHAFEAWDITKGDSSIIIGICDNGVYQDHEDLTHSIAVNYAEIPNNGIDDDQNGYIDDYRGVNITAIEDATKPGNTFCEDSHGSSVAGIAGATVNNNLGIAGVGYACKIFPIKAGYVSSGDVYAGYEGLIYAAVRGFKVVNCSWGSPNSYSMINESVIRYVQSRDVAIVVAAGNGTGIVPWYPAAYPGVLGVGETDIADDATFNSAVGSHSSIMAPGNSSFATTNQTSGYTQSFGGSSASAPIVAGVVAIVRHYYPSLSARQALEHVRLTADNIEKNNVSLQGIIAGRVNMLTAVSSQPMSRPSLRPVSWDMSVRGRSTSQFFKGDTVSLSIQVENLLASSGPITCSLSVKDQFFPFRIPDSVVLLPSIGANAKGTIATFKFIIPEENSERTFLRVNLKGTNYTDYFLIPFNPSSDIATFSNSRISVSLGDQGQFGFAGDTRSWRGIGLSFGEFGNLLYTNASSTPDHSFFVASGDNRIVSAGVESGDFTTLKQFTAPESTVGIMSDTLADESIRLGVEVKRSIAFLPNKAAFKVKIDIKNVSSASITDLMAGQYLDVDIGAYGIFNYARLLPEAVPAGSSAAAEVIGRDGTVDLGGGRSSTHPMLGCLVLPVSPGGVLQMAGVLVGDFMPNGLTSEKKIALLSGGTSLQSTIKGDIGLAGGMRFPGEFQSGETRTFELCFGAALTKEELSQLLLECAVVNSVNEQSAVAEMNWTISPNPATEDLNIVSRIDTHSPCQARMYSALGEEVRSLTIEDRVTTVQVAGLAPGMYYIHISSGASATVIPFVVLHN